MCQDLNLGMLDAVLKLDMYTTLITYTGVWKLRNIQNSLEYLIERCPELRGLNLSGWKGLNADTIKYITTECQKLERLDLSSINVRLYLYFFF